MLFHYITYLHRNFFCHSYSHSLSLSLSCPVSWSKITTAPLSPHSSSDCWLSIHHLTECVECFFDYISSQSRFHLQSITRNLVSRARMTVTYSLNVANAKLTGFSKLLTRWKGSIYKLLYREMAIYITLYYSLSFIYRYILNSQQREWVSSPPLSTFILSLSRCLLSVLSLSLSYPLPLDTRRQTFTLLAVSINLCVLPLSKQNELTFFLLLH